MSPLPAQRVILPSGQKLVEVVDPNYEAVEKAKSRAEVQRESATAADITPVVEVLEVLGTVDVTRDTPLSIEEIDFLADELIRVRSAKDVIEGRENALKKFATQQIDMNLTLEGKDPVTESGVLVSATNKVKLSKEVSGGKLNVDMDLLKEVLDEDQFVSITNYTVIKKTTIFPGGKQVTEEEESWELNEEALEKELKLGNLGMEQIVKATIPGKTRTAFYVRAIK